MKATVYLMGWAMVLAIVPAISMAQAKPAETKSATKPTMQHDMGTMKMDSGMKHEMPEMGKGTGGPHDMAAMKGLPMSSGWKEFDAFHAMLMSLTGPSQKGDLMPARLKAAELVTAASVWAASKGPAKCDNTQARRWIPDVVRNAKSLASAVDEKGSDANVKAELELTHTQFEKVAMPCLTPAARDSSVDRFSMETMQARPNLRGAPVPPVKKP